MENSDDESYPGSMHKPNRFEKLVLWYMDCDSMEELENRRHYAKLELSRKPFVKNPPLAALLLGGILVANLCEVVKKLRAEKTDTPAVEQEKTVTAAPREKPAEDGAPPASMTLPFTTKKEPQAPPMPEKPQPAPAKGTEFAARIKEEEVAEITRRRKR